MEDSTPSPHLGYSGAQPRGAGVAQFSGADEDAVSSVRMRANRIMCSEVTSMRDEQTEQDSDSVTSEQRRYYPVAWSGRGVRQSIEDLRTEFGRELRAQQEMFQQARADLEARQEEAIANAWAVLESSMMGIRGPENEQTRTPTSIIAGQHTPAANVASEQSIQSPSGFGGVQTPSIYLTPAGGASPVHLNTGNYVTPELFLPVDTAYYMAPSTCIPASARSQTERTPSFVGYGSVSSSGVESSITPSNERSRVDCGYNQNSYTSGYGTPVSNSNGQQTEQGTEPSTRPQAWQELSSASGKPVETEQKKVLVFNTDTKDSDEHSGDKKRGRRRASSKKRSRSAAGKDPDDSGDRG